MPALAHTSVSVRVPATSANLGPGFDCLGIALNVYNDLSVRVSPDGSFVMSVEGEGAADLPRDKTNLVVRGLELAFREAGFTEIPPLHLHLVNRIPIGAGLGSSSAAIIAGLLAGLALTGTRLPVEREERMLQLAATVEGHVDNLAPCIYGGMQIGVHTGAGPSTPPGAPAPPGGRWYTTSVSVPQGLQAVLFVPAVRQETEACRAMLPPAVPRGAAVFNIGRAALLVNCFASGCLDDLRLATQDALHQPVRSTVMPALLPCVQAALDAGARGAFLSGAGSSILALTAGRKGDVYGQAPTERCDAAVARAMAAAAALVGMDGRILITTPAAVGAYVMELDGDAAAALSGSPIGILGLRTVTHAAGTPAGSAATPAVAPAAAAASPPHATVVSTPSVRYVSTRAGACPGAPPPLSFADVVFAGVAPDGGLYVPVAVPVVPPAVVAGWATNAATTYADVVFDVLRVFVGDDEVPSADLRRVVDASYRTVEGTEASISSGGGTPAPWSHPLVAPLVPLPSPDGASRDLLLLELFHGPTAAFKDAALQLLGNLFEYLLQRRAQQADGAVAPQRITILGATSGDTGSAAIAGLRGKAGVDVVILHPEGRVAPVQAMQMTSVLDANVHNVALRPPATFDDAQALVKAAFGDAAFAARHRLSAINSINMVRVLAQAAYYGWAAAQLARRRGSGHSVHAAAAAPPTFVVPSGNFGNALAGHYARLLRIVPPGTRLVVATNANDVLHRFFAAGDYAVQPTVAQTLAPSMDIQRASNLERYLYLASGGDAAAVRRWMEDEVGGDARRLVTWPPALAAAARADFGSDCATDAEIDATIARHLRSGDSGGYALCPHTAAGVCAAERLPAGAASHAADPVIVLATAHPAKFSDGTPALRGLYPGVTDEAGEGGAAVRPPLPPQLRGLSRRPRRVVSLRADAADVMRFVDDAVGAARP